MPKLHESSVETLKSGALEVTKISMLDIGILLAAFLFGTNAVALPKVREMLHP